MENAVTSSAVTITTSKRSGIHPIKTAGSICRISSDAPSIALPSKNITDPPSESSDSTAVMQENMETAIYLLMII